MGSTLEINDTLQLSTEQGFPADLFNLERHRQNPITLADVQDRIFEFQGKSGPRFYQLNPIRVFWVHNIGGRWLAWGQIVIQELNISKNPNYQPIDPGLGNFSDPKQWVTSGKYQILKIYDPQYQETFTRNEFLPAVSYFQN